MDRLALVEGRAPPKTSPAGVDFPKALRLFTELAVARYLYEYMGPSRTGRRHSVILAHRRRPRPGQSARGQRRVGPSSYEVSNLPSRYVSSGPSRKRADSRTTTS